MILLIYQHGATRAPRRLGHVQSRPGQRVAVFEARLWRRRPSGTGISVSKGPTILASLFGRRGQRGTAPSLPDAVRVYAVADIHGRLDCLNDMMTRIDADVPFDGDDHLVFLGDYIDRGPDSARVIDRLIQIGDQRPSVSFLLGNHEETLLKVLKGSRTAAGLFDKIGGRETLLSYGVDAAAYNDMDLSDMIDAAQTLVPAYHVSFLETCIDRLSIGDYRFVHAGVRPRVAFDDQKPSDLRWIRTEFLDHPRPFDGFIVHGHTVVDDIDERLHRLNLDTGAYASGRLSAVVLEQSQRRFIQTAL